MRVSGSTQPARWGWGSAGSRSWTFLSPGETPCLARAPAGLRSTERSTTFGTFAGSSRVLEIPSFRRAIQKCSSPRTPAGGRRVLSRLVGMFAFGIWDGAHRRLFLARDRLGKKPLYYATYAGRFAFASELKAFLVDPELPRDVDPEALALYLRFGYVPAPLSIFRAARKLPPAHTGTWDPATGSLSIARYWDPMAIAAAGPMKVSDRDAEAELESLLGDAVRLRMIADVPLGAFLSGGIDSSLVVALMKEQCSARSDVHRPLREPRVRRGGSRGGGGAAPRHRAS